MTFLFLPAMRTPPAIKRPRTPKTTIVTATVIVFDCPEDEGSIVCVSAVVGEREEGEGG